MKKFHAVVLIGSVFLFSGCLKKTPTTTATIEDGQTTKESVSEWQKIGEAMESGKSVKCEMTNTQTQQTSQYYMNGEKIRVDTLDEKNPEASGSFLTDSEFMYTWNDIKKEGVKFAVVEPTEDQDDQKLEPSESTKAPDFSKESAWDDYKNLGYTVTCTTESVDDKMFTPPADVKFTDMSAFMQKPQDNGEAEKDDEQELNQEQIDQIMKQYQE